MLRLALPIALAIAPTLLISACTPKHRCSSSTTPSPVSAAKAPAKVAAVEDRPSEQTQWTGSLTPDAAAIEVSIANGQAVKLRCTWPQGAVQLTVLSPSGAPLRQDTFQREGSEGRSIDLIASESGLHQIKLVTLDQALTGAALEYQVELVESQRADETALQQAVARYESPAILDLWRELQTNPKAIEDFDAKHQGHAIVEELPEQSGYHRITYYRIGTPYTAYAMLSGGPDFLGRRAKRLAHTNLFFVTQTLPDTARFLYAMTLHEERYAGEDQQITLESKVFDTYRLLELPAAPPSLYTEASPEQPKGTLRSLEIESTQLGEVRKVRVYTPPGYNPKKTHHLAIIFDGESYSRPANHGPPEEAWVPGPTILDGLIADKKIPPTIAVFVDTHGKRRRELTANDKFTAFIAEELLPWARTNYPIGRGARHVLVAGASFGGLAASYLALKYPKRIGKLLSQSGSYYVTREVAEGERVGKRRPFSSIIYPKQDGLIIEAFRAQQKLPLRIYMEVGSYEVMAPSNRQLKELLLERGYDLEYWEYDGGHAHANWRTSFARGLIWLLRP